MTAADLYLRAQCDLSAGNLSEAEMACREILAQCPDDAATYRLLGSALAQAGRLEEAEATLRASLSYEPGSGIAHSLLGGVLGRQARFTEALAMLDRALELSPGMPQAHWNRAHVRLTLGDYAGGFADYEWGFVNRQRKMRTLGPAWNGEALPRGQTLFVWAEQGLGDTIMAYRWLPLAQEVSGARVVFECQRDLVRLLARPEVEIYAATEDGATPWHFDRHVSLLSLPHVLGLTQPALTGGPYLTHPAQCWAREVGPKRIGLCWHGNRNHPNDANRSMPPEPLWNAVWGALRSPDEETDWRGTVISLQPGEYDCQDLPDLYATAGVVSGLDLVITVDTALAHLAGALGVPAWVLLPYAPDWRWGERSATTPWYGSARLYRQERAGDWEAVLARVAGDLRALCHVA
jgi:hypothetical protein